MKWLNTGKKFIAMKELTFDTMLEMIRAGQPFSYARYGDGEWNAILQKRPGAQNCDGHQYFPDMGLELRRILESRPEYYLGLQRLASEQNTGDKEFDWLVALNKWSDNEIMHRASIKGRMKEFFAVLTGHRLVLVGNDTLKKLDIYDEFILIPEKDCWQSFIEIKRAIGETIEGNDIVLYCASMMSEVLIDEFKHCNITQIDCGSVFDPYVGRKTRSYHKNLVIE